MMKSYTVSLFLLFCFSVGLQAQDSTVIHTIDSLLTEAGQLANQQQFEASYAVNATAEELTLQHFSDQSSYYGRCLRMRGRSLMFDNRFPEADSILNVALSILRTTLGPEHEHIASCLNVFSVLYNKTFRQELAIEAGLEAADMQEKILGETHIALLSTLTNLAGSYQDLGRYEEAEETYLKIKGIYEKTGQTEIVQYTYLLNNFGLMYRDMGRLNESETLLRTSRDIRKRVLGETHALYGHSLASLGNLYQDMGYLEQAEKMLRQSLDIQAAALGPDHPQVAVPCHNLATLYTTMGNYDQAEQLFLRAQTIWVNALGPDHPNNGYCLNSLAGLYETLGRDEHSEKMYLEAASLFEKAFGKSHFLYAQVRQGLGIYYANRQQYELAEPLLREVLDIMTEALGKTNTQVLGGRINLANLQIKMNLWDQGQQLLVEARTIFEEDLLDTSHPYYLNCLTALASIAKHRGDFGQAVSLYETVKENRKAAFGPENLEYAYSCFDLAHVQEIQGSTAASIEGFETYTTVAKTYLTNAVSFLSEEELFAYTATFERDQAILYASIQHRKDRGVETGNLTGIGYNVALFQKGFLQTAAARLNTLAGQSPETRELSDAIKGFKRRLNKEITRQIEDRNSKLITELKDSITLVEKGLARLLAGQTEGLQPVDWKEVQAAMAPGEVAIEFIQFERRLFERSDSIQIAALLLKPGQDEPLYVPITEQQNLARYLESKTDRKADYVNELYAWAERGLINDEEEGLSLIELIWSPLAPHLADATRLYIASAGLIHRINLGALPVSDEEVLADRYQIVMLTSTRQIVGRTGSANQPASAWVFGGIAFDPDTLANDPVTDDLMASRATPTPQTENATRGESWAALKWTDKEREQIAGTLRENRLTVTEWSGHEAREEVCKTLGSDQQTSPSVLHLSTHGFFFPDPTAQSEDLSGEPVFRKSDNPMIRSGLLLAGANYAWQHGHPRAEGIEDGILTSDEISQLNLSNTELVVLSACETGLGDIEGNEGVYGLQRAFKIAGAKYLIMSLWQVPDRETMQFMTTFYRNWLSEGESKKMSIPDAFRKTQLEMRDRFFNPYSWAGFVLVE